MSTTHVAALRAFIQETRRELEAAVARRDEAARAAETFEGELTVLQAMLERRSGGGVEASDGVPESTERDEDSWVGLSRTDAVEKALTAVVAATGNSVAPADLRSVLMEHGRVDHTDAISGALNHLKVRGRAHRPGFARWAPGPPPKSTETATVSSGGTMVSASEANEGSAVASAEPSSGTTGTEGGTDHAQDHDRHRDAFGRLNDDDRDDRATVVAVV